jgi:adenylyl- and sulfurtransferase ThiI
MPDVDEKVAAAKADIATAQAARARAEHEYAVQRARAESAAGDLKEEFGVRSASAARELVASLEAELEAECSAVQDALSRAGMGEQQ